MNEDSQPALDLLGDPWTPLRDPRGRKRHRRQPEVAERIGVLRAMGGPNSTIEAIARAVNLSEKTLTKYYSRELEHGPEIAEQLLDAKLWEKAMAGNVPAIKEARKVLQAAKAHEAVERRAHSPRAPALGKKEERQLAAEQVGGKYATPPAPPRLAIVSSNG